MIKLAREAGWEYANNYSGFDPLWKFGELVAAAEREACAKVCNDISKDSRGDWKNGAMECEEAIRARGLHDMNKAAEKNGEEL
jgi:hypothetical protein